MARTCYISSFTIYIIEIMKSKALYGLYYFLFLLLVFCIVYTISNISKTIENLNKDKVSLPEEISLVEEGDTLIVEKVTDSIYIGFKR
jgi:hypothetical protein